MYCPECHYESKENDTYCRHCGEDLTLPSTSLVTTTQTRLPALQNSQLPRKVAASVGAVALGVGIELLRRSLLTRLTSPVRASRSIEKALPALSGLNDVIRSNKTVKVPKGYIIDETIVYTRRVIRRER
jgi:zinc-ribbon domain